MMTWVIDFMWGYTRALAWVFQAVGLFGMAAFAAIWAANRLNDMTEE